MQGHKCSTRHLDTSFSRQKGYSLKDAKQRCAIECDVRDDCFFADLYFTTQSQSCYLTGKDCGDWQNNKHRDYYMYKKGSQLK